MINCKNAMEIITGDESHNHFGKIVQLSKQANTMMIVSAFLSDDLGKMFDDMSTINMVTIYTNLGGYEDAADKTISLQKYSIYCREKGIDLLIKSYAAEFKAQAVKLALEIGGHKATRGMLRLEKTLHSLYLKISRNGTPFSFCALHLRRRSPVSPS